MKYCHGEIWIFVFNFITTDLAYIFSKLINISKFWNIIVHVHFCLGLLTLHVFDTPLESSSNSKSSGGRQLVPGLLRLPDNKYNGTAYRQPQGKSMWESRDMASNGLLYQVGGIS